MHHFVLWSKNKTKIIPLRVLRCKDSKCQWMPTIQFLVGHHNIRYGVHWLRKLMQTEHTRLVSVVRLLICFAVDCCNVSLWYSMHRYSYMKYIIWIILYQMICRVRFTPCSNEEILWGDLWKFLYNLKGILWLWSLCWYER